MTMNKNIIKSLAASMLVAATACEDYNDNFDGLQSGTTTTDVKTDILISEGKASAFRLWLNY